MNLLFKFTVFVILSSCDSTDTVIRESGEFIKDSNSQTRSYSATSTKEDCIAGQKFETKKCNPCSPGTFSAVAGETKCTDHTMTSATDCAAGNQFTAGTLTSQIVLVPAVLQVLTLLLLVKLSAKLIL
jgi:hypothetical protein